MSKYLALISCLIPALSFAQGSGSKASLSLLELDDPIVGCLQAGTELAVDPEKGVDLILEDQTPTLIWAITFDQSLVEVEYGGELYFAEAGQAETEPCE